MAKQTKMIAEICVNKNCYETATIGVYKFGPGDTDVDLNMPAFVTCGKHKRKLNNRIYARNVALSFDCEAV